MTSQTKKVPKLRFTGFGDKWEAFEFKDLARLGKEKYNPITSTHSYRSIELESIESGTGTLIKVFNSKDQKSLKTKFQKGDVLYGKLRPYLRKYIKAPFDGVCTTEIWVLRGHLISNELLYYVIQTDKFNEAVNKQSGSKMPRAEWSIVKSANYTLPKSKDEQEKIAEFMGGVDAKITHLQQRLDIMRDYKKGVIGAIFSGKLRFKSENGDEYPAWQSTHLGNVAELVMGQSPESIAYNLIGDGMYLIQGKADIKQRKTAPRSWTSSITKTCDIGDIILTVRAPSGYVARSGHKACIGRGVCAIKAKAGNDLDFIYQYLLWFEPRWASIEQGSTFMAISGDDIKSLSLRVPSLEEQAKIVAFLTAIDDRIKLDEIRLMQAKRFKKALLQDMFV